MHTESYVQHGCKIIEHRIKVPLDHKTGVGEIELFAREVLPPGRREGEQIPALLFLQGGPGGAGPRVGDFTEGWQGAALKNHRLILMDQRGTGQSSPLFACNVTGSPEEQADFLALFLQEQIIADAEALRQHLGIDSWSTLGQSYGGFLTLTYLSQFPSVIDKALVTGGLPGLGSIDEIYRETYPLTAKRNQAYFGRYPRDEQVIRKVAAHLNDTEERLPTGERLSATRFRTIGQDLGMQGRFDQLHYLFEDPFITVRGQKRLSPAFLAEIGARVSLNGRPLYYVLQEAIYGPTSPLGTRWAAERLAGEFAGFHLDADPLDESEPWYLTGEHVFHALFAEDPALAPLLPATEILAARTEWTQIYDHSALAENDVPVAAAVYYDDMFVPRTLSMATSAAVRGTKTWVTSEYQHDGLRVSGPKVYEHLEQLVAD